MIRHVTLLALEQMLMSSAAIPLEMLEAMRARLRLGRQPDSGFDVEIVSQTLEATTVLGGFSVFPQRSLEQLPATDLIIVPALWRNPKPIIARYGDTVSWLSEQYHRGASLFAVGTGVCLLAEAGILDGKPATTHWHYLDTFARDYPKVNLQRKHLLTQADRIFCAASVNSGADMMIHMLGLIFGRELALQVEQQFSPEVRQPFEKRVFYADGRHQHGDETIALLQTWLSHNYQEPVVVKQLADMAQLSVRQLDRRFRAACGESPMAYLQRLRCEAARELLQNTNLSVADVAGTVGYSDSSYFTRVFKRQAGQSPQQYRQKVRAKLFDPVS